MNILILGIIFTTLIIIFKPSKKIITYLGILLTTFTICTTISNVLTNEIKTYETKLEQMLELPNTEAFKIK